MATVPSRTNSFRGAHALPTPSLTGSSRSSELHAPNARRVLLMPAMPPPRSQPAAVAFRGHRRKASATPLARSRPDSISLPGSPNPPSTRPAPLGPQLDAGAEARWVECTYKFEVVQDALQVEGYQIYAVEKWIVERTRPVTLLIVYTGDPQHQITVTALTPASSLSPAEAQTEWDKAMHDLRRDGARPKESDKGVLMVTSLANFRSDYTIVLIPSGNFSTARERLYTNINLLRMGCSGRSALTLEEPSDTTKDRFIDMYHMQDKIHSNDLFDLTVLELVRFIQAGLAICGMFDIAPHQRNGLLCDVTVDGLQRWILEIGEPYLGVEPMERVADPTIVSAMFSLILTVRNKLCALKYNDFVPKDPFLDPQQFSYAFASFLQSLKHKDHADPPLRTSNLSGYADFTPLTRTLIVALDTAYERARQLEPYKVHKVLLNKLDDLATDLRGSLDGGAGGAVEPTTDLAQLAGALQAGAKDGAASLRYLWTARPGHVALRRKRKERPVLSDGEREDADVEREGGQEEEGRPWGGKVQRKIEAWAGLGRSKKPSVDLGPRGAVGAQRLQVPSAVAPLEEDEDGLSSGAVSPISGQHPQSMHRAISQESGSASTQQSDYERRVTEFNRKRPATKPAYGNRISSWSDPVSAREIVEDARRERRGMGKSRLEETVEEERMQSEDEDGMTLEDEEEGRRRVLVHGAKRRRSFGDAARFRAGGVLPIERMKIDVELCGQLLIMRRREDHLRNVVSCLEILAGSLSRTNAILHEDYEGHKDALRELERRMEVVAEMENERTRTDVMMQDTNALCYESEQFRVLDLWHTADPPRQRVLQLREKVFGAGTGHGRRLPQGVRGAHGRFNRLQWTLDGSGRLVDWAGRTESDVEEEGGLPETVPHEEVEDVVEHAGMKPTWLLRLFHSGLARWGGGEQKKEEVEVEKEVETVER